MPKRKTQWEKRVDVFLFTYSCLMNKKTNSAILKEAYEEKEFDANQMKIIEYYLANKDKIIELIAKNLSKTWTIDRLPETVIALLASSYCEFYAIKTDKKIIIDQALITANRYINTKIKSFINAILDKILI